LNYRRILIPLLLTVPGFSGCARRPNPVTMTVSELGLSMQLPSGWKQGRALLSTGNVYEPKANGPYCFESVNHGYPFGVVREFSMTGFSTLEEYVRTPPSLYGAAVSKEPRTVSGMNALEVVGNGLGEKQAPVRGIYLYVQRGDKVLLISFIAAEREFSRYEPRFREALNTLKVAPLH
jgi:hypothetical protein